jgi:hypothetical protein
MGAGLVETGILRPSSSADSVSKKGRGRALNFWVPPRLAGHKKTPAAAASINNIIRKKTYIKKVPL